MSMILQNVEPSKRKRKRTEAENALLHLYLKEQERHKVEKDRSLQDQRPMPQPQVKEAPAPPGKRRSFAAKIGRPQAHANMEENVNMHTYQFVDSMLKEPARKETHAFILTGLAESIHRKQTNLRRDSLSDCQ